MTRITFMSLLIAVLTLAGCQTDYEDMTAAQRSAYTRTRMSYIFKPDPNAAIQVTYRIDDSRFFTLENYDRCYGDNYFNNTTLGIHQKVWTGDPRGYRGRVVVDDRSGMNVVLPTAENRSCGDRGCTSYFAYSTDSGRTFNWFHYLRYTDSPSETSEAFTFILKNNAIYIAQLLNPKNGHSSTGRYPLIAGFIYGGEQSLPNNERIEFNVAMPAAKTPSGQDHFTCDASIRSAGQPKTP